MITIEQLFGTLQQSVVATWRKHLRTAKYAKHMALNDFYEDMPDKVDALIEAWMGANGRKIKGYENILQSSNMNTLTYLKELKKVTREGYELMGEHEELKSLLDDIMELINSTLYKVKELNESNMIDLADYINEAINEARLDLNSLSDKELIYFLWEAWSGFESNGRKQGMSGNPRAEKLEQFIDKKFPTDDYFGRVSEKIMDLDNHLKEMLGMGEFEDYNYKNVKIPAKMMKLIEDNIDWLIDGKKDKNYKIK